MDLIKVASITGLCSNPNGALQVLPVSGQGEASGQFSLWLHTWHFSAQLPLTTFCCSGDGVDLFYAGVSRNPNIFTIEDNAKGPGAERSLAWC